MKIVYIEDSGEEKVARGSIIVNSELNVNGQEITSKNKKTVEANVAELPEEGN